MWLAGVEDRVAGPAPFGVGADPDPRLHHDPLDIGVVHAVDDDRDVEAVVDELARDGYGLVGGIGEYENSVRMAYVRGPEGIIVSLFEQIG